MININYDEHLHKPVTPPSIPKEYRFPISEKSSGIFYKLLIYNIIIEYISTFNLIFARSSNVRKVRVN